MFQNIKVEIIYYKTATDFEMEFNLSGCCRMRLLTDKAPDRKTMINQLARAVNRSRVIMISGALFGEEGVINTAAAAIGRKLCVIDNKQFGISGEDNIEIIENAVPLVNGNGIFGGCIIEQGPQTLILLTENKDVRKNIMQTLIHSYIQDVCTAELNEKDDEPAHDAVVIEETTEEIAEDTAEESVEEPIEEATEEVVEAVEDEAVETADNTADSEIELVLETEEEPFRPEELISDDGYGIYDEDEKLADAMIMEDEDYLDDAMQAAKEGFERSEEEVDELVFEPEYLNRKTGNRRIFEYAYAGTDADEYVTGDEEEEENAPVFVGLGINLPIIIISVLLLLVVAILCYCIFVVPQSQGIEAGQYLKEMFDTLFG